MSKVRDISPMLKSNFNVSGFSCLTEEENQQVRVATVSLHYTHTEFMPSVTDNRLLIHVDEPENGSIAKIIDKLVNEQFDIEVQNLNGYGKAIQTKVYKICKLVGYSYELNYAASGETCRYPLEFSVAYTETK